MKRSILVNTKQLTKFFRFSSDLCPNSLQFRRQIILMKKYLSVCRVASSEKLLLRLASRQHFVDGAELYSIEDLVMLFVVA